MDDMIKQTVGEGQELLNMNGGLYIVGWDEHGWFTTTSVVEDPDDPDVFWCHPDDGHNFTKEGAATIARLIEEGE